MTYKPRLHHFTRLLMSVAVGLSFTGCGNSSNGGSTGSSFEPVPLINETCNRLTITDDTSAPYLSLEFFSDSKYCQLLFAETKGNWEAHSGTWTATQLPNNTYQIQIPSLGKISDSTTGDCTMTCHDLKLTIPADQLKAYREGRSVNATLRGSFTHKTLSTTPCKFNSYSTFDINKTVTIEQDKHTPG